MASLARGKLVVVNVDSNQLQISLWAILILKEFVF